MNTISLTPKKETPCKIQIFDNKRIVLSMHGFNPYSNRDLMIRPTKQKNSEEKHMPLRAYCRLLKRTYRKLNAREYNTENTFLITLKLDNLTTWKELNKTFKKFTIYLTRQYGKFEYFRAIEFHQNEQYHIHAVIEFEQFPTDINAQKIAMLWKLGQCHIMKVYDIYGILQYLTKYKKGAVIKQEITNDDDKRKSIDSHYTFYPKRGKILVASQNFGKPLDKNHIRTIEITKDQKDRIYSVLNENKRNRSIKKEYDALSFIPNNFLRIEGHNYQNENFKGKSYCIDKLYANINSHTLKEIYHILGI